MKVEIEIPEDKLRQVVERAIANDYNWQATVREHAARVAREHVGSMPVEALVREYIAEKLSTILDDVVYKSVRHVVKLAVDKELAVARETFEQQGAAS